MEYVEYFRASLDGNQHSGCIMVGTTSGLWPIIDIKPVGDAVEYISRCNLTSAGAVVSAMGRSGASK